MKLGVIGAGNIAETIIGGLILSKSIKGEDIVVSKHNREKSDELVKKYKVISSTNEEIITSVDVLLLGLKPNLISDFMKYIRSLKEKSNKNLIVVSVAAGVSIDDMFNHLSIEGNEKDRTCESVKVVRAMPNTSCKVLSGVFAVSYDDYVSESEKEVVRKLFSPLGVFLEVEESKMNAISVLAGCAPAFIYEVISALSDGGVQMGLSREDSLKIAANIVQGAAKMVKETKKHPTKLKEQITSPGGSTIEGIYSLEKAGFRGTIMEALQASLNKYKK